MRVAQALGLTPQCSFLLRQTFHRCRLDQTHLMGAPASCVCDFAWDNWGHESKWYLPITYLPHKKHILNPLEILSLSVKQVTAWFFPPLVQLESSLVL